MNTPSGLADAIRDYVRHEFTALLERYAPDGCFDGVFGGFATGSRECADAAYTLSGLSALGVEELGHHGVDDLIRQQLARIDGPSTNTFYSYRTGEVIAAGGGFDGHNPLLRGLSDERLRHLREACDSTDLLDADTLTLKGLPNNYWGVLARGDLLSEMRRDVGDEGRLQVLD